MPAISRLALVASVLALAAVSAPLAAQDINADAAQDEGNAILVWGTKVKDENLGLDEADIEIRQADHLSDLLRPFPGVDIGGTHSVNTRINFRGLDDRDLNVYIDGALQTNYVYHHIGNLLINPDILKSADLQLGTNSVTHGGLGGAVRFETKEAGDLLIDGRSIGGRIAGTFNSNDLFGGSAALYGEAGALDLFAYYNYINRGNFEDGSGRSTIGSDGETQNVLLKAGVEVASGHKLRVSYDRYWDEGDYTQRPDMGVLTNAAITGDILLPTEYRRETIRAGYEADLGDAFQVELTFYTNDLRLYRDESNPGIPRGIRTDRQVDADNWGINLLAQTYLDAGGSNHTLQYGFEYFDQKFDYVPDVTGNAASQIQNGESLAIFLEDSFSFADDRLLLRPGIRYNHYKRSNEVANFSDSWDEVTWAILGEAEVVDGLRLFASYTTLFRGPELTEPFVGTAAISIANPDLEPETGHNFEAGARFAQDMGAWQVNLSGTYFSTHIDNYIAEVRLGRRGPAQDQNIGTAKIDGFELAANIGTRNIDVFAGFSSSVLDASELNTPPLTESLREVGDKLTGEVRWTSDNQAYSFGLNAQHFFEKPANDGTTKPSYSVVNLQGRANDIAGLSGLSLILGIDNLFNETYTSHASRAGSTVHPVFGPLVLNDVEPGRNFKVTAAYQF